MNIALNEIFLTLVCIKFHVLIPIKMIFSTLLPRTSLSLAAHTVYPFSLYPSVSCDRTKASSRVPNKDIQVLLHNRTRARRFSLRSGTPKILDRHIYTWLKQRMTYTKEKGSHQGVTWRLDILSSWLCDDSLSNQGGMPELGLTGTTWVFFFQPLLSYRGMSGH